MVDIRGQIFLFLGVDERIHKLHCHLLACRRTKQSSRALTSGTLFSFHFRLLDVASDVENVHIVDIFQIVFKVQLIEPQRDPKRSILWWKVRCTHQRNYKVWPSIWSITSYWKGEEAESGQYRKTCFRSSRGTFFGRLKKRGVLCRSCLIICSCCSGVPASLFALRSSTNLTTSSVKIRRQPFGRLCSSRRS